jgi:hypothetical protein
VHVCMYVHVRACVRAMCVCMHVRDARVCMCVRTYVCMNVCVHVWALA